MRSRIKWLGITSGGVALALATLAFCKDGYAEGAKAIREKNLEGLRAYLESGGSVNSAASDGETLLMVAAAEADPAFVELLLEHGAEVNQVDDRKRSPLARAASRGHEEVVRHLLENGADPTQMTVDGETAASYAIQAGSMLIVELLLPDEKSLKAVIKDQGRRPLHVAALSGNAELIELFLKRKADPNVLDSKGQSALFHAAYKNSPEIIKALVNAGAQVDQKDRLGATPLQLCALSVGRREALIALLELGADPFAKDNRGETVREAAVKTRREDNVEAIDAFLAEHPTTRPAQ